MDFTEIKQDVKEIKSDIGVIKETLVKNTTSLDHHIKRTDLNEERIQKVEYWLLGLLSTMLVGMITAYFRSTL